MADDLLSGLSPAGGEAPRKRGRPKGSSNKRSLDLARYVEAHFGGMTPGQQAAAVGMVTAREVRAQRGNVLLALAVKAGELAVMLKIDAATAWDLMRKERADLLPYVHQKRPQAVELGGTVQHQAVITGVPMQPAEALPVLEGDFVAIQGLSPLPLDQVAHAKSHDGEEPQAGQGVATPRASD